MQGLLSLHEGWAVVLLVAMTNIYMYGVVLSLSHDANVDH